MSVLEELQEFGRIVFGHLPLIGITYRGEREDKRAKLKFRRVEAVREVLEAALDAGLKFFAASSPDFNELAPIHLTALRELREEGREIRTVVCVSIPLMVGPSAVDTFRRWATQVEAASRATGEDVLRRVLEDPILSLRPGWDTVLPTARPYGRLDILRLKLDSTKMERVLDALSEYPVDVVELGSEADFLSACGRLDLLGQAMDMVREVGFEVVFVASHMPGATLPNLSDVSSVDGYVAPVNKLGVMMLPTVESTLEAIRGCGKPVLAVKVLAGGRLPPLEAFEYAYKEVGVTACVFGALTPEEVRQDVEAALKVLGGLP